MKKIKFFYGILVIAALAWTNYYDGAFVYVLLYMSICMPLIAFIYLQIIYKKVDVKEQKLPEVVNKSTPFL